MEKACYAAGKRYVGGIAGKASVLTSCCFIVNINGEENTGALCGDMEAKEQLHQNYFVDNGPGAADGISYKGKAEAIRYED